MRGKDTAVCGQAQESLEQNVCARCDRRRLCGHLAEALAILKTQPSVLVDLRQVWARNALQKRLDFYEYSYPLSLEFCQFSRISANEARQILFRARDLSVSWTEMETPECKDRSAFNSKNAIDRLEILRKDPSNPLAMPPRLFMDLTHEEIDLIIQELKGGREP